MQRRDGVGMDGPCRALETGGTFQSAGAGTDEESPHGGSGRAGSNVSSELGQLHVIDCLSGEARAGAACLGRESSAVPYSAAPGTAHWPFDFE